MNVSERVAGEERLVGQLGMRGREGLIPAPGADWAQDRKIKQEESVRKHLPGSQMTQSHFKVSGLGVS